MFGSGRQRGSSRHGTRGNAAPSDGERGGVAVMVGLAMVALLGLAALAVDVGNLYMKRREMQTAADSGALAGAGALVTFNGDQIQARTVALQFARRNVAAADSPSSAARPVDVTFPTADRVQVTVGLTRDRGNPARVFLGSVLGVSLADVSATATAELRSVASSRCLMPLAIPANFTWNDVNRNGALDPDNAMEMGSVIVNPSGYPLGTQITLKIGDSHQTVAPGQFNPVDYPPVNKGNPVSGGSAYRENLIGCAGSNRTPIGPGDEIQMEPGNMVGPTKQGIQDLIAQDPGATWTASGIVGSRFANPVKDSPRVALILFYDPRFPPTSGRSTVFVQHLGAVFVDRFQGNDLIGRFIRAVPDSGGGTDQGSNLLMPILVQ